LDLLRNPACILTEPEFAAWDQQQQRWQLARQSKVARRKSPSIITTTIPPLPAEPTLGAFPP
jgi:hypothetical protein